MLTYKLTTVNFRASWRFKRFGFIVMNLGTYNVLGTFQLLNGINIKLYTWTHSSVQLDRRNF